MSEDRIRTLFHRADSALGYAPPDLDETIRQAKRETAARRAAVGIASLVVIAIVGVAGFVAFRPKVSQVTPAASSTPTLQLVAPCASNTANTADEIKAFVDEFVKRRVAGAGAEGCLSKNAVDQYRVRQSDTFDPNKVLCLYACGEYKVTGWDLMNAPQQVDANSWEVIAAVLISKGEDTGRVVEHLSIGPGMTADGRQALVIRGVGT